MEANAPTLTLSVAEAAAYIGVSTKTIYRAIESRRLRHARIGQTKCYRIRPEWLDEWIDGAAIEPDPAPSEVQIKHAAQPPRTARRGPYAGAQTPRRGILK